MSKVEQKLNGGTAGPGVEEIEVTTLISPTPIPQPLTREDEYLQAIARSLDQLNRQTRTVVDLLRDLKSQSGPQAKEPEPGDEVILQEPAPAPTGTPAQESLLGGALDGAKRKIRRGRKNKET